MPDLFGRVTPPELMSPEQRYLYEERWAILHFEAGLPEAEAKAKALIEVQE